MSVDYDKIVKAYLRMRAAKAALKKEYEKAAKEIDEQMNMVEMHLMKGLIGMKVKSMAASTGLFYLETIVKAEPEDWPLYRKFVVENDAWDGIHKRVGSGFVSEYMEKHDGEPPPGIKIFREQVVRVRATDEK